MTKTTLSRIRKLYYLNLMQDYVLPMPLIVIALMVISGQIVTLTSVIVVSVLFLLSYAIPLTYLSRRYEYDVTKSPYQVLLEESNNLSIVELSNLLYKERLRLKKEEKSDLLDSVVMDLDSILQNEIQTSENIGDLVKCLNHPLIKGDNFLKGLIKHKLSIVEPTEKRAYKDKDILLNALSKVEKTVINNSLMSTS